jgi:hypothetical protein
MEDQNSKSKLATQSDSTTQSEGEKIQKLAESFGGIDQMDEDNKAMLSEISKAVTSSDILKALLTDPKTGKSLDYATSRLRFG